MNNSQIRLIVASLLAALLLFYPSSILAEELNVAVASNFSAAIKTIAKRFEAESGHKVLLSFGATGKHYAQIINGAPFDAFFAADVERPKLLEDAGVAVAGTRFSYAAGKLVLWSPDKQRVDSEGEILKTDTVRHLAVANPRLAPYGRAAKEVMQSLNLWKTYQGRLAQGENIGQTFQFVASENAEIGFVAYSQIKKPGESIPGSYWEVPKTLYSPIIQQAVLIKDSKAARALLDFVKSSAGAEIIRSYGYNTANY